jgi:coproporphyrinogen III oxidase
METADFQPVRQYLEALQENLARGLRVLDPEVRCRCDRWTRGEGGGGCTLAFAGPGIFEKAGVNFSAVHGERLPPASTVARPHLAGHPFQACGVSVIVHPSHPHVPTTHMNVRFFAVFPFGQEPVWWFGGGFDLTPCIPYREDAESWHRAARNACATVRADLYTDLKAQCDAYFFLPHRQETRGVGGIFFDDFCEVSWEKSFQFMKEVGDAFWPAYAEIVERRRGMVFTPEERQFQLLRRGRYAEFNLLYDRGTRFGLESGGRTQSILISLPPLARWDYDEQQDADLERLAADLNPYLQAQDWLEMG